jgi:hypothetical protein
MSSNRQRPFMKIAIGGAGNIGVTVGERWVKAGHDDRSTEHRPGSPSRYRYRRSTKGCSVVFKQLVIRPFSVDFDLSGRSPVYKTAALPIELRRRSPEGIASPKPTDSELEAAPETAKTAAWRFCLQENTTCPKNSWSST